MTTDKPGTSDIECPQCSTVSELREGEQTFCPSCDFPLFWADPSQIEQRPAVESAAVGEEADTVGIEGDDAHDVQVSDIICRNCALRNPGDRTYCMRCGHELPPPEEWFNPDVPLQVETEAEPSVWRSATFAILSLFVVAIAAFLVAHFALDLFWPHKAIDPPEVVATVPVDIGAVSVLLVGSPRLPMIVYSQGENAAEANVSRVRCRNIECSKADDPIVIDPEGSPGTTGVNMSRVANGPLIVYQRPETLSLVAVRCGTLECDDNLGTRRFFAVSQGGDDDSLEALTTFDSPLGATILEVLENAGTSIATATAGLANPAIEPGLVTDLEDANQGLSDQTGNLRGAFDALVSGQEADTATVDMVEEFLDNAFEAIVAIDDALLPISEIITAPDVDESLKPLLSSVQAIETQLDTAEGAVDISYGFSPSIAVTGGVPIVAHTDSVGRIHVAYICDQGCADDDGVVNTILGLSTEPGAPLAIAIPRAGLPYIVYRSQDNSQTSLELLRCEDVKCGEPLVDGSVEAVIEMNTITLGTDGTRIGRNVGMVIDPETLFPTIVFQRFGPANGDADWKTDLLMLKCPDQDCDFGDEPPSDPDDENLFLIDSWIAPKVGDAVPVPEFVVERGPSNQPVVSYVDEKTKEIKIAVWCAVSMCGNPDSPKWLKTTPDKISDKPVSSVSSGVNLAMDISNGIALISYTDKKIAEDKITESKLKVVRVDLVNAICNKRGDKGESC